MKWVSTLCWIFVLPFLTEARCFSKISLFNLNDLPIQAGLLPKLSAANCERQDSSLTKSGQSQIAFMRTWKSAIVPHAFFAYCFMKKTFQLTLLWVVDWAYCFQQSFWSWLIQKRKMRPRTGWPNIFCAHYSMERRSWTEYVAVLRPSSLRKDVMTSGLDYIGSQLSYSYFFYNSLSPYIPIKYKQTGYHMQHIFSLNFQKHQGTSFPVLVVFQYCQIKLQMDKVLQHGNDYATDSQLQWPGITSSKFPRPRLIHPRRDIISPGLEFPDQESQATRRHFQPRRSGELVFKPILKQVGEMEHWHLRPSNKKILNLQFSQPHPRPERTHFDSTTFPKQDKFAGIRTFYNGRLRDGITEYSLQDRLQRKVRIDQLSLRKNAFRNESLVMSGQYKSMKF